MSLKAQVPDAPQAVRRPRERLADALRAVAVVVAALVGCLPHATFGQVLPGDPWGRKPVPPTAQELDQRRAELLTECKGNRYFSTFHECACVVDRLEAYTAAHPGTPLKSIFSGQLVGNTDCLAPRQRIYDFEYELCSSTMKTQPGVPEEVCRCSTDAVVRDFFASPDPGVRPMAALRRKALVACGAFGRR